MRLLDNLRNAEQKGVSAVRRGMEKAREEWGDMERRIRQRMRVYPQKLKTARITNSENEYAPDSIDQGAAEPAVQKPIVSIHGQDVRDEEFDQPAA